jgi:hypothetical protein
LHDAVRDARRESNVFLMHQSFISLALLIATTLVAGFFAYIHSIKRQTYLLLWTAAWAVFALRYVGPTLAPNSAAGPLQSALNHWLFALSGVLFFLGAQLYSQRKPWTIPGVFAGVVFGLWAAGNATNAVSVSALIPASFLYIGVAVGNAGRPAAGGFLRFLGSSVDRSSSPECHTRTPGPRHECGRRGSVCVCGHAHGHGAL